MAGDTRTFVVKLSHTVGLPWGCSGEEPACQSRRYRSCGSIPGSGRSLGEGNCNSLQYSCLETSMDRGAWWATVYGLAKSQTWLSDSACSTSDTAIKGKREMDKEPSTRGSEGIFLGVGGKFVEWTSGGMREADGNGKMDFKKYYCKWCVPFIVFEKHN